jgi:hypothetical protein
MSVVIQPDVSCGVSDLSVCAQPMTTASVFAYEYATPNGVICQQSAIKKQ